MNSKSFEYKCIDKYKDKLFLLTRKTNILMVYETRTKTIRILGKLKDKNLYCASCLVGDKILYFPAFSDEICEYSISDNSVTYIPITIKGSSKELRECWSCTYYDGSVYVACGTGSEPLVRINPTTYEAYSASLWNETFEKKYGKQAVVVSQYKICTAREKIWLPLNEPGVILQYNPSDESFVIHEVPTEKFIYHTIEYDGEFFWITGESKKIVKWDEKNNHIDLYMDFPEGFAYRKNIMGWPGLFYMSVQNTNSILYIPLEGNMCVLIDKKTGTITPVGNRFDDEYCFHAFVLGDRAVYFELDKKGSVSRNSSFIIDENGMREFVFSASLVKFAFDDLAKGNEYSENDLYYEEYDNMLNNFVQMIIN